MEIEQLRLDRLHETHAGVTPEVNAAYLQAAAVCLGRLHEPPRNVAVCSDQGDDAEYQASWPIADERARRAWEDRDATRDGAYCVVLAALEAHIGLVAIARAAVGTGADYLIGTPGSFTHADGELDLENAQRLEVSGDLECDALSELQYRTGLKLTQLRRGKSSLPGIAGVVAFNMLRVELRTA